MSYYKLNNDGTIQSTSNQHNGFSLLSDLITKENGSYYTYYLADGTPDLVKEQEATTAKLILDGEALVNNYIQSEVNNLNTELGTKFGSIHNIANYKDSTTYPHAVRCKELWDWNEQVWVAARGNQPQAIAEEWTSEMFIAILPVLGAV